MLMRRRQSRSAISTGYDTGLNRQIVRYLRRQTRPSRVPPGSCPRWRPSRQLGLVELRHLDPQWAGQQVGDQSRPDPEHLDENLVKVRGHPAMLQPTTGTGCPVKQKRPTPSTWTSACSPGPTQAEPP